MRKNDVRKWIHAILDMLPLLIIPIFALAVRSDNNYQPITLDVQEKQVVNFAQYSPTSVVLEDLSSAGAYYKHRIVSLPDFKSNDIIYYRFSYRNDAVGYTYLTFGASNLQPQSYSAPLNDVADFTYYEKRATLNSVFDSEKYFYLFYFSQQSGVNTEIVDINLFNLTRMFGSGNEPSIADFKLMFPDLVYPQSSEEKILVPKLITTSYSDSDVGSQMVYTLYNSVEKYFNFNNVFTFDQIYDWLSINIFAGQPPLSVFIVWNIFLYEFLMDLLFLLYALFMFFIDMCANLIEHFTCQARGGR